MDIKRDITTDGTTTTTTICELHKCTYSGEQMGDRTIKATFNSNSIIDFALGDYVELELGDISPDAANDTVMERFVLYSFPSIKKVAQAGSYGEAFEYTITFKALQYELATVQMRDLAGANGVQYTGFDEFSIYGNVQTLCNRIQLVLDERFGTNIWTFSIADIALETDNYQFDFSQTTCWDALCMITDEEALNLEFFIINRVIYIGYKGNTIHCFGDSDTPYTFKYGKTSQFVNGAQYGGLVNITKTVNADEMIVNRLRAYGSDRNINRFYNSDNVAEGRYITKLMLPSFSYDGTTDYIDSEESIAKYGIIEGSHIFDDIYPSIQNVLIGNMRSNILTAKIVENSETGSSDNTMAVEFFYRTFDANGYPTNTSTRPASPVKVIVHATGKVVQVIVYPTKAEQLAADGSVPANGHAFLKEYKDDEWVYIQQTDSFWMTSVTVNDETSQYNRKHQDGTYWYSAYCFNANNPAADNDMELNAIIGALPISVDTDTEAEPTFVVYVRDFGFDIKEQYTNGEYVHIVDTATVNFSDGVLGGMDFTISTWDDSFERIYADSEDENDRNYYTLGARWKLRLNRDDSNPYSYMPNSVLNAAAGNHISLLNIYMPDVYVYWAEERLLVKAQEYLDNNDHIENTYSMDFDNIRFSQIKTVANQIREGSTIRIQDTDLAITDEDENGDTTNYMDISIKSITIEIEGENRTISE